MRLGWAVLLFFGCGAAAASASSPGRIYRPLAPSSQATAKPTASQAVPSLLLPVSVAYDSTGNLYFADAKRHQVFELTLAGAWSVIAGTGEQGFAGDGGLATAAMLNSPRGLAVAADGTLYISDTGNERVRAVRSGVISTAAGSGVSGYSGDGPALLAALSGPTGLALDTSGSLLICDTANQRIRGVAGGNLVTVAGNGIQGYSGDGGAATAAELDTPLGVAVAVDGTILIADTHNQRVRALRADGTISTFAGNGLRGFAGDGGQAGAASLDVPFGIGVGSGGSVLIADAGNQRIRSVSAQGVITTIAGSGVQGFAADATAAAVAALNSPRSVAAQQQGQPVFADTHNGLVRELATDNALYTLALLAAPRASSIVLNTGSTSVYGQGRADVSVTGSAATPQGTVTLLDNGSAALSAKLTAGNAALDLGQLSTGTHALIAQYAGDGLNGSSSSSPSSLTVSPATVVATATAATALYGGSLPSLSGTVTGILPQDAATVRALFSSVATVLSSPGIFPITATLIGQGSGNYALTLSPGSGSLVISPAPSLSTLAPVAQTYAGLPLLLSASVASTTSGAPSGSVEFLDGSAPVGSAVVVSGAANTSILSASQGTHTFTARYSGDTNFLPSTSSIQSATVAAMPDFSLAISSASASVQGGAVAVFTLGVTPQDGPFTGAVTFSVTGLSQGATASFSPHSVVPGSSAASITLSVQTVARTGSLQASRQPTIAAELGCLGLLSMCFWRKKWRLSRLVMLLIGLALANLGCGTRTSGTATNTGQTSTLTIQGTGTNLGGAVVSHSVVATLTVL